MKIFNAVHVLIFNFICIIIFTPISRFVCSNSIYQRIPPVDVSNPNGTVIFDVLRETDDFYPLGLISNPSSGSREFIVDDSVTFGKDITIVFGTKYVSLSPFARNIRLTAKVVNLRQHVYIDYDLNGTRIVKKYHEQGIAGPGQPKSFKFVQTESSFEVDVYEGSDKESDASSEGSDLEESKPKKKMYITPRGTVIEYSDYEEHSQSSGDEKVSKAKEQDASKPEAISVQVQDSGVLTIPSDGSPIIGAPLSAPAASEGAIPSTVDVTAGAVQDTFQEVTTPVEQTEQPTAIVHVAQPSEKIEILDEDLSSKAGFKSADIVKAPNDDFRCVWFENNASNEVYKRITFKNHTFPLSKSADAFEVCYMEYDPGKYNMVVSSQFSSIVVEQIYRLGGDGIEALVTFEPFVGLQSYTERRMPADQQQSTSPFELSLDNFTPDANSSYDKVEAGKCTVYRYKDGLEDDSRIGPVTSLKFGDTTYAIPSPKKFVMVSKCHPHLSTYYVVIMLKDFFQYESVVFYSVNDKMYRKKNLLEDDERLELINMTSKVWHKRQSSGAMGNFADGKDDQVEVLCLSQFTKKLTNQPLHCKSIEQLSNFQLLYHGEDLTNIVFPKRSPKSSVLIGNAIFDLNTDNNNEKYIYLSHPAKEPISLLVENSDKENYSMAERTFGSNLFLPLTNSFGSLHHRSNKKDLNFGLYRSNLYGITWDYNDYLKKFYLFPSKFPDYCLGDLTFWNMKIMSNKEEGYKQITSEKNLKIDKVNVIIMLQDTKIVLEVSVDKNKFTKVEVNTAKSSVIKRDEL
ncbi:conserved hypothetical protein [Theileria orientalis strain Shintoku]|uniref:Uncharacterized protein n=1 Tax=Theileria orientalis strain Shintoku TaxID=869250 RepID=J7MGP7_THEOR|nr:conserved hypothetical protein [Theileria orientalis strain Shintoku]BAM38661.1 conserved hypothetical protein [Theileria orientalis strain Shintoku]|eukprot:XP_009688962.1 conserved hypothetical protein [Theileria orientalis strain Shintoku]